MRSTIPAGEIAAIRFNFDTDGFTIVDHRDIPGRNVVALIEDDQPCLAERSVRHVAEPILLLAHADRERLLAADVQIDYRETTPNFDPEASDTSFKTHSHRQGQHRRGVRGRPISIVEGEYRTGHQEQLYIEPNGVIAVPDGRSGGITVYGSMQCPYYVHRALTVLLGLPDDKVRVIQTETGGGFGGKEEYPSMIAGHAALVARKSRRPVKLVYDRVEDMLATTKRHPAIVRHRTGVKRDGTLTAIDIDAVIDGGAYATLSAVVLSRGADPRERPVPLRSRPDPRAGGDDQHAAQWGVPGIRRAADAVCGRSAHGSDRRPARPGPGADPRDQRVATGRHDGDRPAPREGLQRAGGAAARRSGAPTSSGAAARWRGRHGASRIAASASRCSSTARASPAAARSSSPRKPRWR